ncbi:ABC transporter substrate-binding protein [Bradyrhizobium erythrophlei]|uniref:Amino acid/amide ABC transporter substrate-binding protein, HAAT family n=1 Tax=Bradyrhizobium erythrophlei TaxID=1437360 RepID=A0A1M7UVG5_9BRAD|nr:ABC transporter substrate-binding protein [Bradyrhizobium erythrophlei]SHN86973.1 amino acid/amide ABC transporter substrate-binding protein, HAAT family [Bradyrhizobium erythrophlei]
MISVISRRSLLAGISGLPFASRLAFAQTSEPVRIGVLAPLTGGGGPYGADIVKASKLAADQINAAGGVLGGRKIELFVEDDETNATAAVKAARKLLDIDKVVAITAVWGSAPILAVRPLTLEKNVVLTALGSADEVTEGDTKGLVWRFQARASSWGEPAALAILKGRYKKIGLLQLQNPFVAAMIPSFVETIEKGGAKVISNVEFKPDQPSYRAEIEKVYAAGPEAVFVPGYVNQFTSIAKEIYRGGYKGKVVSLTIAAAAGIDGSSPFIKNVGKEVAEGIEHVQPISPLDRPEYKAFVKAMGAPEGTVFPFAALQFDAINVLAASIEKAKSANPVDFAKQVIQITNGPGTKVATGVEALALVRKGEAVDFTGAGQDIKFDERGELIGRPFLHQVIRDGKDVILGTVGGAA